MTKSYTFEFSRKRLWLLGGCMLLAGLLAFMSGMLVGVVVSKPAGPQTAAPMTRSPVPSHMPSSSVDAATLAAGAVARSAARPHAAASPSAPPIEPAAAEPAPAQGLPAEVPAARTSAAGTGSNVFSLQIGLFEKPEDASKLLAQVKDKNPNVVIVDLPDSQRRVWYAVRIPGFPNLAAASAAASDFNGKSRIQALVRKSDSL